MSTKIRYERVEVAAKQLLDLWTAAQSDYRTATQSNDQLGATWARSRSVAFEQALEILWRETGEA